MNWSSHPYSRIAIAFATGIFIQYHVDISVANTQILCVSFFSSWMISAWVLKDAWYKQLVNSILMVLSVVSAGVLICALHLNRLDDNLLHTEEKVTIVGLISEKLRSETKTKYVVKIGAHRYKTIINHTESLVILSFDKLDSLAANYQIGDKIMGHVKLKNNEKVTNPEMFDYTTYLTMRGIKQSGNVKAGDHKLIAINALPFYMRWAQKASKFWSNTMRKYMDNNEALGIAEALLIGQQIFISKDIYQAYSNTGAIHVLSVSGLHVAIFISGFVWLFGLVKRKDIWWKCIKILSLLILVWFYAIMTGLSPSVVRSAVMVSLFLTGRELFKGAGAFNILSVSAIIMLIYNPLYLFQISFLFSYISLLSILYFHPYIKNWVTPTNKVAAFFWSLFSVSLAAQIMIFPFTIYYFHQFPVYFAISGLVAVPLVTGIIYLGTAGVIIEVLWSGVSKYIFWVLQWLISILNQFIQNLSEWPLGLIQNIWISDLMLILMILSIVLMMLWIETKKQSFLMAYCTVILMTVTSSTWAKVKSTALQSMVIYDVFGGTLTDVFDHGHAIRTCTGSISEQQMDFITKNNLIKHHIKSVETGSNWLQKAGDKVLYIYHEYSDFTRLRAPREIDILFITDTQKNSPDDILPSCKPDIIVLAKNLKPWIRKKWLNLHVDYPFVLHDIATEGAFIYKTDN
jgi:competence protein ComEC